MSEHDQGSLDDAIYEALAKYAAPLTKGAREALQETVQELVSLFAARCAGTAPEPSDQARSGGLLTALRETYEQHIGIAEPDGPDGPYMWCACGWRSDDLGDVLPGAAYAEHLADAQHAAAVEVLSERAPQEC